MTGVLLLGGGFDLPGTRGGRGGAWDSSGTRDRPGGAKTYSFTVGGEDEFDLEQARRWMEAQTYYENLADDPGIAARAIQLVKVHEKWTVDQANGVRDIWRSLDWILKGNTLSKRFPGTDIHVPKIYAMVETLVPRIYDAIFARDDWFEVLGFDQQDQEKVDVIQAYVHHLHEKAGTREHAEKLIRSMLVYGMWIVKDRWCLEYGNEVSHKVTARETPHRTTYDLKVEEKLKLIFEGYKWTQIDPYDLICDPRYDSVERAQFVGDTSRMSSSDLMAYRDLGIFKNVDEVLASSPVPHHQTDNQYSKQIRSRVTRMDEVYMRRGVGQEKEYPVTTLQIRWSPTDDHEPDEYTIVIANHSHCLQVQKNPNRKRERNYIIARCSDEPFDMFATGPLDHTIRQSIEMDENENLGHKAHGLSVAPFVWLPPGSDLPNNLLNYEVGQSFTSPGEPKYIKSPSTLGDMIQMKENLRRDMEEASGAVNLLEGGDAGNTATETIRRSQEANRRIRRMVKACARGFTEMLQHSYAYAQQYVSQRTKFRVLGKEGVLFPSRLGHITPEHLALDVDIRIHALADLETRGIRGTQIASAMAQAGPFVMEAARMGMLNIPALIKEIFASHGIHASSDILRTPESLDVIMSPSQENVLLKQGQEVEIHPGDNTAEHILSHFAAGPDSPDWNSFPQDVQDAFIQHIGLHRAEMNRADAAMHAAENTRPPFPPAQMVAEPRTAGEGRHGQTPDLGMDSRLNAIPGQAPGPNGPFNTAAADRQQPISQVQNQGRY